MENTAATQTRCKNCSLTCLARELPHVELEGDVRSVVELNTFTHAGGSDKNRNMFCFCSWH